MNDNISAFNSNEYDSSIEKTIPYYNQIQNEIIEIVNACYDKNLDWLDVGCGTGSLVEKAIKQVNIKSVTLIDISSEMLSAAQKRLEPYNAEKHFLKTNVNKLDIKDKFDVITAIQVFHYLMSDERKLAVKNCYSALKPGGVLFTCENLSPFSKAGTDIALERWKNYQIKQGKSVADAEKHISRFGKIIFQ